MVSSFTLRNAFLLTAAFVALLWSLQLIAWLAGLDLLGLALLPRHTESLPGILTAPLAHGSWQHLAGNTPPLLLLGSLLLFGYPRSGLPALLGIWLLSGAAVWLFARHSYHLGASGLTHGIFFYLFIGGILRRDRKSAVLLLVAFYLYGGMVLSILPLDPTVSFESHLFGALAGALLAWRLRRWDPPPPRRPYSWEMEDDEQASADDSPPSGAR